MPFELILSGRVQGVACRHYCRAYGRLMGLHGSATNLMDGTVRVLLDTSDIEKTRGYARMLMYNPRQLAFYGAIDRIEMCEYSGPFEGDYVF